MNTDRAQYQRGLFRSNRRQPAGRTPPAKGREPKTCEIRFRSAALLNRISQALDRAYGSTARPPVLRGFRTL